MFGELLLELREPLLALAAFEALTAPNSLPLAN
jgi:hypothetical protein